MMRNFIGKGQTGHVLNDQAHIWTKEISFFPEMMQRETHNNNKLIFAYEKLYMKSQVVMYLVECIYCHAQGPGFEPQIPTCRGEAS